MMLLFTFWKEDVFQKTLFYYSPTSTYRTVQHCTSFIKNNETDIILVTKYIEKKIGAKNLVLNDKYGKIIFTDTIIAMVKHTGFINGKKRSCTKVNISIHTTRTNYWTLLQPIFYLLILPEE